MLKVRCIPLDAKNPIPEVVHGVISVRITPMFVDCTLVAGAVQIQVLGAYCTVVEEDDITPN